MTRKALLVFGYSAKNAGDMAITVGAIDWLQKKYNDLSVISRYSAYDNDFVESSQYLHRKYPTINIIPSPFKLNRANGKVSVLKSYIRGVIQLTKRDLFESQLREVDDVFFNGGNLLRCNSLPDAIRLIAVLSPLKAALRLNKRVFILPHSTARTNLLGRLLLRRTLERCTVVFVREPISFKQFSTTYPKATFRLTSDCAFAIQSNTIASRRKRVAITTRSHTMGDLSDFGTVQKERIKRELTTTINYCIDIGMEVTLVSQTRKDVAFTEDLFDSIDTNPLVNHVKCFDVEDLIALYAECQLLIGMRLHSIILALHTGTPVIGFFSRSWGHKNPGLLTQFQQKHGFLEEDFSLLEALKRHNFANTKVEEAKILSMKASLMKNLDTLGAVRD